MEDFSIIYNGQLTGVNTELFNDQKGCIVKNLMLYNTTMAQVQVDLTFDDVLFSFELQQNDYLKLDMLPYTKKIEGSGDGVNIHISGLIIT